MSYFHAFVGGGGGEGRDGDGMGGVAVESNDDNGHFCGAWSVDKSTVCRHECMHFSAWNFYRPWQ